MPEAAGFTGPIRKQAFEEFHALPVPSQSTEEWRYTDLSGLALSFDPYTPGGRAQNLDEVPEAILAAAGAVGERAGLQIQHNSDVMLTRLDPALAAKGVIFADLDAAAATHPDLVEASCTAWSPPPGRSSPPCTARSAPAAPSSTSRATPPSTSRSRRSPGSTPRAPPSSRTRSSWSRPARR